LITEKNRKKIEETALYIKESNLIEKFPGVKIENLLTFPHASGIDFTSKYFYIKSETGRKYYCKETEKISTHLLYLHFTGKVTIGLTRFPHSKIRCIDIDKRSNEIETCKIVDKLVEELGTPFYIEYSPSSGGYHIYFQFDQYISDGRWKQYEEHFYKKYNMIIEIQTNNKVMRVPISAEYEYGGIYLNDGISDIRVYDLGDLDTKLLHYTDPNQEIITTPNIFKLIKEPIISYIKNKNNEVIEKDYSYGCGTRYSKHFAIGFEVIRNKKDATFDDYIIACEKYNDGTSKDMKKIKPTRNRMLLKQWQWIREEYGEPDCSEHMEFFSDEEIWLASATKNKNIFSNFIFEEFDFEDGEYEFYRKLVYDGYTEQKIGKLHGKVHERFVNDTMLVIEHLLSYEKFRSDNGYNYTDEKYQFLNEGVPFGLIHQNSISNYFSIKNIRRIMKFLVNINFLTPLSDSNGFEYSFKNFRHVKHYVLTFKLLYINYNYAVVNMIVPPSETPGNINNVSNFFFNDNDNYSLVGLEGIHLRERLLRWREKLGNNE
jgi:hypothetical protein